MSEPNDHAGAPANTARPWRKLHLSSVVVLAVTLAILTVVNIVGDEVTHLRIVQRGWPVAYIQHGVIDRMYGQLGTLNQNRFYLTGLLVDLATAGLIAMSATALAERRRRRCRSVWQFGLREALVAVAVAGVICALAGLRYQSTQSQRRELQVITRQAEKVGVNWDAANDGFWDALRIPTDSWNSDVVWLSFVNKQRANQTAPHDAEFLSHLSAFPRLGMLHVSRNDLRGGELSALARAFELDHLAMQESAVDDALIQTLPPLPNVHTILLAGNNLTDKSLEHLRGFPALEHIDVSSNPGITDAGLIHLENCRNLKSVRFGGTSITSEGAARFRAARPDVANAYIW